MAKVVIEATAEVIVLASRGLRELAKDVGKYIKKDEHGNALPGERHRALKLQEAYNMVAEQLEK